MPEHSTQTSEPFAHPLLAAAGCPPSGNGALEYVQQLVHALEAWQTLGIGTSASEWMGIAKALKKSILTCGSGASVSPTPSDLIHQPWGNVHACIDARAQVRRQSKDRHGLSTRPAAVQNVRFRCYGKTWSPITSVRTQPEAVHQTLNDWLQNREERTAWESEVRLALGLWSLRRDSGPKAAKQWHKVGTTKAQNFVPDSS